jgi:hypothetical protein
MTLMSLRSNWLGLRSDRLRVKRDRQMTFMRNYLLQMNRLSFRNNPLKMKTSGKLHLMDESLEFEKLPVTYEPVEFQK